LKLALIFRSLVDYLYIECSVSSKIGHLKLLAARPPVNGMPEETDVCF
jgi:hypothetical protein